MNCVNHPEVPVTAYCQHCGKAMCAACMRSVGGVIYCEPCLAERLGMGASAPAGAAYTGAAPGAFPGVVAPSGPHPATAFILGFIPGVGAMYNGQFIKGLIHVLIFIILIGMTEHVGIFGILIAAWIAYQVFDAFETAKARRDGRPLPDPFGLNDFGARMGIPMGPAGPVAGTAGAVGPTVGGYGAAQGFTGGQVPPVPPASAAGFTDPYGQPYAGGVPPVPPPVPGAWCGWGPGRGAPVGAVILIGLGVLFLLNTLDVFHFDWFGRLWPVLLICFGVALFLKRSRELPPPPPPPPPPGGAQ